MTKNTGMQGLVVGGGKERGKFGNSEIGTNFSPDKNKGDKRASVKKKKSLLVL